MSPKKAMYKLHHAHNHRPQVSRASKEAFCAEIGMTVNDYDEGMHYGRRMGYFHILSSWVPSITPDGERHFALSWVDRNGNAFALWAAALAGITLIVAILAWLCPVKGS